MFPDTHGIAQKASAKFFSKNKEGQEGRGREGIRRKGIFKYRIVSVFEEIEEILYIFIKAKILYPL